MDKEKVRDFLAVNALTATRGIAAFVGLDAALKGEWGIAAASFSYGALTDNFDGKLAVAKGVDSKFGWLNDRVNDALLYPAILIAIQSLFIDPEVMHIGVRLFQTLTFITWMTFMYIADRKKGNI
jgi:phosphatidylglycerophosphate synthase